MDSLNAGSARSGSEQDIRLRILAHFQDALSLSFNEISTLDSALTHRSYLNEAPDPDAVQHNERLEFLGDSVLGHAIASWLYERLDGRPEGELARIKSIVVAEPALAEIAMGIGLPEALRLGKGEIVSGGRAKKAILADALEALIGAVFTDQGYAAAVDLVRRLFKETMDTAIESPSKDFKTILQEYSQKRWRTVPSYTIEKAEGPEHDRSFWVLCRIGQETYGPAVGKTRKSAEQAAARKALARLSSQSAEAAQRIADIGGFADQSPLQEM